MSVAQESADPTRSFRLTLSNRLSATDNQARGSSSAGVTTSATTRVGFSAITENELNQLNFTTSTALRFSNSPDDGSTAEMDQPKLNLRYVRNGATSSFSISSTYSRDDIEYLSPLEDFVDEDGVLIIPDDIDDLDSTGTRVSYNTNIALDLMRDAPVSLRLTLGQSGRNYIDVSDPDLNDVKTTSYGATLGFRFATDFTGNLSYTGSQYRADDSDDTKRDRQNLSFGISKTLSNVLEATASVGWSDIETETNSDSESNSGVNGSVGLTLARPNGEIGLNYATNTNVDGHRQTVTFRRSLELPSGSLAGNIGLTQQDHGEIDTVAGLSYKQTLPSGSLSVSFNRSIRYVDDDDAFEQFTSASASHSYQINNLSSLTLRGALSRSEETDLASLGLTYKRSLTTDWDLSTGYNFTSTKSDTSDSADTHQVFVGLSRAFDLPF
jgi:hypothetical protein